MRLPWVYVRDRIGREWGIPGPMVDEYPHTWVAEKLEIMRLEAEATPRQPPAGRKPPSPT